jgi:hypothetical protein
MDSQRRRSFSRELRSIEFSKLQRPQVMAISIKLYDDLPVSSARNTTGERGFCAARLLISSWRAKRAVTRSGLLAQDSESW